MELEQLKRETQEILLDLLSKANLHQGQILVLGLSTSEVAGASIGKKSSMYYRVSMRGVPVSWQPSVI